MVEVSVILGLLNNYLPLTGGTMSGDINLAGNALKTSNLLLRQKDANSFEIRDSGDTDYKHIYLRSLIFSLAIVPCTTGQSLQAANLDNGTLLFLARDNGVGLVEIARLVGAADPYFQISKSLRFEPQASAPGTLVEGMLWYDAGNDNIQLRKAASTATLASRSPCTNQINTTWASATITGTENKIDVTGHGVARYVHTGDGEGQASCHTHIEIDGTTVWDLEGNVAKEIVIIFNSSLTIEVNGNGANVHSGGECYGNYE